MKTDSIGFELLVSLLFLLLLGLTGAYGYKLYQNSQQIGQFANTAQGYSSGFTSLDFKRLELVATRAALGDPTLEDGELDQAVEIVRNRGEILKQLATNEPDPRTVALLRDLAAGIEPLDAIVARPGCDTRCRGASIAAILAGKSRQLARLQTRLGARDLRLRVSLLAAVETASRHFLWISAALLTFGIGFCAYMLSRNRKLREQREALQATASHLTSVSEYRAQFLAGMSHEFRTPLNAIRGFAQLIGLRAEDLTPSQTRDYAGCIDRAAKDLDRLTTDILDLSKVDAGKLRIDPELVDVRALVVEVCEQFFVGLPDRHRLSARIEPGLKVAADRAALKRCLTNLVSNALKFSDATESVLIRAVRDGRRIVFEVRDRGRGIAREDVERVWRAYESDSYQRKGGPPGTGLGLAITKALVELHGGRVAIESEPGIGTSVFLYFPAMAAVAEPRVAESSAAA